MDVISIYIFIIGLCIGSFLNVCIDRIEAEESIVWPPSHCDNCGCKLRTLDLIPVISYILLKGRCRRCHEKISVQYPIIELLNAALYFLTYNMYGLSFYFIKYCILISIMLVTAVIDFKTHNIYTKVSLFGLATGVLCDALGYIFFDIDIFTDIIGFLIGLAVFYIIVKITKAMGTGDIDIAAICGLFLGKSSIILAILISFIAGGTAGVLLMWLKRKNKNYEMAFMPYLALGVFIAIFFGDYLIKWYLNSY